ARAAGAGRRRAVRSRRSGPSAGQKRARKRRRLRSARPLAVRHADRVGAAAGPRVRTLLTWCRCSRGRGGSIGRGGGPTYLAIQSQPPGSVRGALRVTEQGEMLQTKFGLVDIALRTLEVYTTATLEATLT